MTAVSEGAFDDVAESNRVRRAMAMPADDQEAGAAGGIHECGHGVALGGYGVNVDAWIFAL